VIEFAITSPVMEKTSLAIGSFPYEMREPKQRLQFESTGLRPEILVTVNRCGRDCLSFASIGVPVSGCITRDGWTDLHPPIMRRR
jgi:hypothetical protein